MTSTFPSFARAAAAAASLALCTLGTAQAQKLLGVQTDSITRTGNEQNGAPDRTVPLAYLGPKVIRLPITWHLMEGEGKGITRDWFWPELENALAASEKMGAKLILQLGQAPCWASSDPRKDCAAGRWELVYPAANPEDYADALAQIAARFKGRLHALEVMNEPNFTGKFPNLGPREAAMNDRYGDFIDLQGAVLYTAIVKAAYPKVKAADPQVRLLAGALAGGDHFFLEKMYQSGLKGHFDAISSHPYTGEIPGDPDGLRHGPDDCPAGASELWCARKGVANLRATMLAHGDGDKEIWFTEFGFSSSHHWNGSADPKGRWTSEQGQARYFEQFVAMFKQLDHVPVACAYELMDNAPHEPALRDPAGNLLTGPTGTSATTRLPTYAWQPVAGATRYKVFVNNWGSNGGDYPAIVHQVLTAAQARCTASRCEYVSPHFLHQGSARFWVTAYTDAPGDGQLSAPMDFVVP